MLSVANWFEKVFHIKRKLLDSCAVEFLNFWKQFGMVRWDQIDRDANTSMPACSSNSVYVCLLGGRDFVVDNEIDGLNIKSSW